MPKSITIGEILNKEQYVQVTGNEDALKDQYMLQK